MNKQKKRLFVDMDGTLAEFKAVDTLEKLYEKGYFLKLKPNRSVLSSVKLFKILHPEIEVYILSSYLSDSKFALTEKNQWLDKYFPEMDSEHRLFIPCGENKLDIVPGKATEKDFLLDDYTLNLNAWEPPAKGIKLLNNINGTKGTWKKNRLSMNRSYSDLATCIYRIMQGEEIVDLPPQMNANELVAQAKKKERY